MDTNLLVDISTNSFVTGFNMAVSQPQYVNAFFLGLSASCAYLVIVAGFSIVRSIIFEKEDI